jgi:hypothetical protein
MVAMRIWFRIGDERGDPQRRENRPFAGAKALENERLFQSGPTTSIGSGSKTEVIENKRLTLFNRGQNAL